MLKALGWSSTAPAPSTARRIASSSVAALGSSQPPPPADGSSSRPQQPRAAITRPPGSTPTTLTSDLSPTFFSPTPRIPDPSSNPYLPRTKGARDATAAWASSGADSRILDVRGRMWGLTRDTRQMHFIPDKDDKTARANAARSLAAASHPSPRKDDRNDSAPPSGRADSETNDTLDLPWGSYLEKKREKERAKQRERDSRRGSHWPPKGGSAGWMPFWRERAIGGTDLAWRILGLGSTQVMSISTSARWRAGATRANAGRPTNIAPPPPLRPPVSASSPSRPGRPYDPATSPPPLHPARLASALGLPPIQPPPPLSRPPPRPSTPPSAPPSLGFQTLRPPLASAPDPRAVTPRPSFLSPPPLPKPIPSTPLSPSRPEYLVPSASPPARGGPSPSSGGDAASSVAGSVVGASEATSDVAVNPGYTIDTSFMAAYESYGWQAKRRYPSSSSAQAAESGGGDWTRSLTPSPRVGPPEFFEYTAAAKVPFEALLEEPRMDRPPHPFDFVIPDTSASSPSSSSVSASAALSIHLDPRDPDTLRLLVVSIRKFAYLGLNAEAQSIFRKVWPNWTPDHASTSSPVPRTAASSPSPSTPPPLSIYLAIINGLLGVGMWEDALAWIETCMVKARHEAQLETYLVFLRSFEWANDPVSAEALYESIRNDYRRPLDGSPAHAVFAEKVYASLIRGGGTASASHRLQTAKHWLSRMTKDGHQPGIDEWRYLMDAATKANDQPLAQKTWQIIQRITAVERDGRGPRYPRDTRAFNAFLHSLRDARVGWINVAPLLAEAIASDEVIPNRETYHLAIRFAIDGGFTGEAVEMVRFMEDVGVQGKTFAPTHATFTILLAGLLRRHAVHRSEIARVQRARNFAGVRPWATRTPGDGAGFKLPAEEIMSQTLAIIAQMKARGLQMTATLYFAIIEYLGRLPATSESALRLANQLVNDLPKPGEAFTEKNRWAVPQMRDAVPVEEMLLLHIVRVYMNRSDDDMVLAVTTDLLERRGEDVNHRTIDELLRAATSIGNAQLVHHLWELAIRVAVREAAGIQFETPMDSDPTTSPLLPTTGPSRLVDLVSSTSVESAPVPSPSPPPSPSPSRPTIPLVSASLLCKATQLLLVFYLQRGPIAATDLAYLTEQWRRVASLGFGLDSRCWAALAEVYLSVGEFEKAFQIANDIIAWRNETLERRFEARMGLTVRWDVIPKDRAESAAAWEAEFARGKDELPQELDEAPDEFRKVVRTSFEMGPTDFKSRRSTDKKSEAFAMAFPPAEPEGGWPEAHPFASQPSTLSDPIVPSQEDDGPLSLSDAPHLNLPTTTTTTKILPPGLRSRQLSLSHETPKLGPASSGLSMQTGLTSHHLDYHPSVIRAWKPSFRVIEQIRRIVTEMEGLAERFVADGSLEVDREDPVKRLARFRARYGRVILQATTRAEYRSTLEAFRNTPESVNVH